MAPVLVTLYDLEGHSLFADLYRCNPSNICAAFYQISTDIVHVRSSTTAEILEGERYESTLAISISAIHCGFSGEKVYAPMEKPR